MNRHERLSSMIASKKNFRSANSVDRNLMELKADIQDSFNLPSSFSTVLIAPYQMACLGPSCAAQIVLFMRPFLI
jgi:hypothetical protein